MVFDFFCLFLFLFYVKNDADRFLKSKLDFCEDFLKIFIIITIMTICMMMDDG
jgi:hypothetical protein